MPNHLLPRDTRIDPDQQQYAWRVGYTIDNARDTSIDPTWPPRHPNGW